MLMQDLPAEQLEWSERHLPRSFRDLDLAASLEGRQEFINGGLRFEQSGLLHCNRGLYYEVLSHLQPLHLSKSNI